MSDELPKRTRRARGKVQQVSGKPFHPKKFPKDFSKKIDEKLKKMEGEK